MKSWNMSSTRWKITVQNSISPLTSVRIKLLVVNYILKDISTHVFITSWEIVSMALIVIFHIASKDKSTNQNHNLGHVKCFTTITFVQTENLVNNPMIWDNIPVFTILLASVSIQMKTADIHMRKKWMCQHHAFLTWWEDVRINTVKMTITKIMPLSSYPMMELFDSFAVYHKSSQHISIFKNLIILKN